MLFLFPLPTSLRYPLPVFVRLLVLLGLLTHFDWVIPRGWIPREIQAVEASNIFLPPEPFRLLSPKGGKMVPGIQGHFYSLIHKSTGALLICLVTDDPNSALLLGLKNPPHSHRNQVIYPLTSPNLKLLETMARPLLGRIFLPGDKISPKEVPLLRGHIPLRGDPQGSLFPAQKRLIDEIQGENPGGLFPFPFEDLSGASSPNHHPSTSITFLYGREGHVQSLLRLLDSYFSPLGPPPLSSSLKRSQRYSYPQKRPSLDGGKKAPEENLYLTLVYPMTPSSEAKKETLNLNMEILNEFLMGSPSSPLPFALQTAGFKGVRISGELNDPYHLKNYTIKVYKLPSKEGAQQKNTEVKNELDKEPLLHLIHETLTQLVQQGIPQEALEAAFQKIELRQKEKRLGPQRGLALGHQILSQLLQPTLHHHAPRDFTEGLNIEGLLKGIGDQLPWGYFESLISNYLLRSKVESVPTSSLSPSKSPKSPLKSQSLQQSPRPLSPLSWVPSLPLTLMDLELETEYTPTQEIGSDPNKEKTKENFLNPTNPSDSLPRPLLFHNIFHLDPLTDGGISYLRLYFHMGHLFSLHGINRRNLSEDLLYIRLLTDLLGNLSTSQFPNPLDLCNQRDKYIGNLKLSIQAPIYSRSALRYAPFLVVETTLFTSPEKIDSIEASLHLLGEVLLKTQFGQSPELLERLVSERLILLRDQLKTTDGTTASYAATRARALVNERGLFEASIDDPSYLRFLQKLESQIKRNRQEKSPTVQGKGSSPPKPSMNALATKLQNLNSLLFEGRYAVSLTSSPQVLKALEAPLLSFLDFYFSKDPGLDGWNLQPFLENFYRSVGRGPRDLQIPEGPIPQIPTTIRDQNQHAVFVASLHPLEEKKRLLISLASYFIQEVFLQNGLEEDRREENRLLNRVQRITAEAPLQDPFETLPELLILKSIHDPNPQKTLELFRQIPEFLRGLKKDLPTQALLQNLIIRFLARWKDPGIPARIYREDLRYLMEGAPNPLHSMRSTLRETTLDDLKALAPDFENLLREGKLVLTGPNGKLNDASIYSHQPQQGKIFQAPPPCNQVLSFGLESGHLQKSPKKKQDIQEKVKSGKMSPIKIPTPLTKMR